MLGIYCRISREKEEGKDRSINDQKLLGIELANKLKLPYKLYIDEGISGTFEIEDRPEFSQLLDNVQEGIITHIYSYDQSRLERNPQVRFALKKLLKENDTKLYTETGEVDLNDDELEMLGDIVSIMNSYYVRITTKKIKSVIKRNVSSGKIHGLPAYGYTKDENRTMVINKEEAKIVKLIYKLSFEGKGQRWIAQYLYEQKIPTRYQKINHTYKTTNQFTKETELKKGQQAKWAHSVVHGIVKNPTYKGVRKFMGETYDCPIIIEPKLWEKVQENLKKNAKHTGKKTNHKYLLNNVLFCGRCGRRYLGRATNNRSSNPYQCSSKQKRPSECDNRNIQQNKIEWFVWNKFFVDKGLNNIIKEHFKETKIEDTTNDLLLEVSKLEKELIELGKRRSKAVSLVLDGTLSKDDVKTELNAIDIKKEDAKVKIKNLKEELALHKKQFQNITDSNKELDDLKKNTPFNQKQKFIKQWIKKIDLHFHDPYYLIEFHFNIPNLKPQTFYIHRKYIGIKETLKSMTWLDASKWVDNKGNFRTQ
jgi:site-specific DNA recombinase